MMILRNTTMFGFLLWMLPCLIDGKLVMKILLNNGTLVMGSHGPVCKGNDIITIKNVLSVTDKDDRLLMDDLDNEQGTAEQGQEEGHRQLYLAKCKADCAG
jgi:hypothetical protein